MSKIESQVAAHERVANEHGRSDRDLYTSHREQLTAVLVHACPKAGGRLALLGAGNCNDVDLQALLTTYGEVHLVDIDRQAIASARAHLDKDSQPRVFLHAPVDLSGLLNVWDAARTKLPTFSEIDSWPARGAQNVQKALPGPIDLVASCCVLTQMSWGLRQSLGQNHPSETQARESLVAAHLRSMCALAAGGKVVLACDMISTEYYPLDDLPANTDLAVLMERLVTEQNYYQGANPVLVRRLLRRDPVISQAVKSATWLAPWLWHGPKERTYLVYALELVC
jgi:hypothetical protein